MPKSEETAEPQANGTAEAVKPEKAKADGAGEKPDKPKPKPAKEQEIVYPQVETFHCWAGATGPQARPPITAELMVKMLGWREAAEDEPALLEDEYGKRITMDLNRHNRPFNVKDARKYAQDIINHQWSGPTSFPGETVNGEAFIISRTANVVSGQKRGAGLILAHQRWERNKAKWGKKWPDGPVLETVLTVGVSDDPRVIATLDNVQARSTGDTFYSNMELWPKIDPGKVRKEMCSMLDSGLDLLWRRSGAGAEGSIHEHQSHSASLEFLKRHPSLVEFVEFIHGLDHLDGARCIAGRGISPGPAVALIYLMGCSKSNPDDYLQAKPEPKESVLDWGRKDKALKFWQHVARGRMECVKNAITNLGGLVGGMGGRPVEKHAIVVKAWNAFLANGEVKAADVKLKYGRNDHEYPCLLEAPICGDDKHGIDKGDLPEPEEDPVVTPAEARKTKDQIRKEQEERIAAARSPGRDAKVTASKVTAKEYRAMTQNQKLDHVQDLAGSNRIVLLRQKDSWRTHGSTNAAALGKILKVTVSKTKDGIPYADLPDKDLDTLCSRLQVAGYPVSLAWHDEATKLPAVANWEAGLSKKASKTTNDKADKPAKAKAK